MAQDYFAVLGLSPGQYEPAELTRRFVARRAQLLRKLDDPERYADSRQQLEQLHLAYAALRDSRRQREYLRTDPAEAKPHESLRALIEASLEDGLLRYSRRQAILERARELGLSEFQAQLLIAQVQFGTEESPFISAAPVTVRAADSGMWVRLAGVGVLALAIFLFLVRWVSG
jgi:hypothetical protein